MPDNVEQKVVVVDHDRNLATKVAIALSCVAIGSSAGLYFSQQETNNRIDRVGDSVRQLYQEQIQQNIPIVPDQK